MNNQKTALRIHFVDQWDGYPTKNNEVVDILSDKYNIIFDDKNPDILFYSSFGWEHLYYNDPLKVFWTPENDFPDFNVCDYALSHLRDSVSGRNCWYPYWLKALEPKFWYQVWRCGQNSDNHKLNMPFPENPEKRPFASFIASSSEFYGSKRREDFVKYLMEKYKRVDCPGKILHNIDVPDLEPRNGAWLSSKRSYIGRYKFNIAFENSNTDGYITEKLVDCFVANTVPIYWGSEGNIAPFPKKAVICANDYPDFDSLIARIREVDENDEVYLSILQSNPLQMNDIIKDIQNRCDFVHDFINKIAREALKRKETDGCYRKRSVGNSHNIISYIVRKEKTHIIKTAILNSLSIPLRIFPKKDKKKI